MTDRGSGVKRFLKSDRGQTMIEYALLAGVMIVALAAVIQPLGQFARESLEALSAGISDQTQ